MRASVVLQNISRLLWFTVAAQAVPMLVGLGYRDERWWAFLVPAVLAAMLAFGLVRLKVAEGGDALDMKRREGFLLVVLGWMVLVFFTALAFHLSGEFQGFADCMFESMSGYTTTGATVLGEITSLPKCVLFARSWAHWIGGMGLIVLSVAILPQLAVGGMQMFSAESSGIDSEKLAPRIAQTARQLWSFYLLITVALVILLLPSMNLFDAINHSFATVGTGGFSTRTESVGYYDAYAQIMITIFMFLSALTFTTQVRAFTQRKPQLLFRSPEAQLYTLIVLSSILLVTLDLYLTGTYDSVFDALLKGSFQVVSIQTTTGFGTADFDAWPHFSRLLLVGLMIIGGCAGTTAGGSKVIRLYVVMKYAVIQLRRLLRPRLVQPLYIGEREVPRETMEGILGYYLLYLGLTFLGSLVLTAFGMDFESGTTASVSAMNSIGPGLGTVGATQNFAAIPDAGKYVLTFQMLLGRLEIYTVLVLFTPHFWRRG